MDIEKLSNLAISESGFIFDPSTGSSYSCNETGLLIVNAVKNGKTPPEVVSEITEAYEVSYEEAERDVMNIIEQFRSNNLI